MSKKTQSKKDDLLGIASPISTSTSPNQTQNSGSSSQQQQQTQQKPVDPLAKLMQNASAKSSTAAVVVKEKTDDEIVNDILNGIPDFSFMLSPTLVLPQVTPTNKSK